MYSPATATFQQAYAPSGSASALQVSRAGTPGTFAGSRRTGREPNIPEEAIGIALGSPISSTDNPQIYAFPKMAPTQETFQIEASNQDTSPIDHNIQHRPSVDRSNQSHPSAVDRNNQDPASVDRSHTSPLSFDRSGKGTPSLDQAMHDPSHFTQIHLRPADQTAIRTESPRSGSQSQISGISYPLARLIPNRPPPIPETVLRAPPPPRPRRPSNNLLDWLGGSRLEKTLGQAGPVNRKASNGNSTKSNFLSFSS